MPTFIDFGSNKTTPAFSSARRTASTLASVLPDGPRDPSIRRIVSRSTKLAGDNATLDALRSDRAFLDGNGRNALLDSTIRRSMRASLQHWELSICRIVPSAREWTFPRRERHHCGRRHRSNRQPSSTRLYACAHRKLFELGKGQGGVDRRRLFGDVQSTPCRRWRLSS